MIPDNINDLINKIKEVELLKLQNQKELMEYCLDKTYPLKERWVTWSRYSIKNEEDWIMNSSDFKSPILKCIADDIAAMDHNIGSHITYDYFLDFDLYTKDDRLLKIEILKYQSFSIEYDFKSILKEEIMMENFGRYTFDW